MLVMSGFKREPHVISPPKSSGYSTRRWFSVPAILRRPLPAASELVEDTTMYSRIPQVRPYTSFHSPRPPCFPHHHHSPNALTRHIARCSSTFLSPSARTNAVLSTPQFAIS
ncbi:hypothetical protein K443DRAFT_285062 [Laccaria amethystina LaAM-08-1]|uniref:Uncharacterized protein n=1 Tax=Laccaria amethystina LaAM-08-1 TaxID=1095629 RepID=A0A0C9XJP3_9AGAR|nr:hypothetical protein K443DRAFT_285062 [Laccaria amethystina LaAM-08-1]